MAQPQTRMTRQRMLILEELRGMCSHPTAEELYSRVRARMPHISLSTVYRNLEMLKCTRCGRVADLPADSCPEPEHDSLHVEGFTVTGVRVEFEGLCDECRLTQ